MKRNVEIKATLNNVADVLERAKELSKTQAQIIKQHDVFYTVSNGRLKMRNFEDGKSELIFYDRPDIQGPKLSEYLKCSIPPEDSDGSAVKNILERALGVRGEVKKTRHLFLLGQTRIHIDTVEGLGSFIELEVMLSPDQNPEEGQAIAVKIMKDLGVSDEDLLTGAYIDLFIKNNA